MFRFSSRRAVTVTGRQTHTQTHTRTHTHTNTRTRTLSSNVRRTLTTTGRGVSLLSSSVSGVRRLSSLRAAQRFTAVSHLRHFAADAAATTTTNGSAVSYTVKNGVGVFTLDDPNSKVNTLNGLQDGFKELIDEFQNDPNVKCAIVISGKSDNWIAGADINELSKCETAEELSEMSRGGQRMMDEIAASKKPIVAAINGVCLGGGLELAMACQYRIATSSPKTKLGLPEVMLGLLPGAGGTQRLPQLVGAQNALPLILTGKQLRADKAKKLQLVDQVCDPNALEKAAFEAAQELASGKRKVSRGPKGFAQKAMKWALEGTSKGREFMFKKAREGVMKQTRGKYPAPLKIIDCVETGLAKGYEEGLRVEADNFGELGMTNESKALVSIFHGQTACKKNAYGKPKRKVETLTVLGAGLMGAGIAQVSIEKGINVQLKDVNETGIARGMKQLRTNLSSKVKRKQMSQFDSEVVLSRVTPITDQTARAAEHLKRSDMVVEAVFEDLNLKHKVVKDIEQHVPEHCIVATNTSALPISSVAEASKRPSQVIGMHYFSPVEKMPLLEIIPHTNTSDDTCAAAVDVGLRQGKTVIVVKDVPGFYVNRSLGPYMAETTALLRDGVSPERLDGALKDFGFPVGPIELADQVGIDVATHVKDFLEQHLGVRMKSIDGPGLQTFVDNGWLGKKTGKGFFDYTQKKVKGKYPINPEAMKVVENMRKGHPTVELTDEDVAMRMASRFINEAIYCLQDGIIRNPTDGDIGAVFGIGFPPFHGGPFRFVDAYGVQKFHDTLVRFRDTYGEHFAPAPLLTEMANGNKKFHN